MRVPSKAERPDLYFAVDGHWNAAGHDEAGRRVAERVLGLVEAPPGASRLR